MSLPRKYHRRRTSCEANGLVEDDGKFRIEAAFLDHGVENVGWRITEPDTIKFDRAALKKFKIEGPSVGKLQQEGKILIDGQWITLDQVSHIRPGDVFAYVVDTRPCPAALSLAKNAKVLICESTYLHEERALAREYMHMTAIQAAEIARDANVETLILTHFSARYRDPEVLGAEARTIFPNTLVAEDLKRFSFSK